MSRNTTSETLWCVTVRWVVFWKLSEFWNLSACAHWVTMLYQRLKSLSSSFGFHHSCLMVLRPDWEFILKY